MIVTEFPMEYWIAGFVLITLRPQVKETIRSILGGGRGDEMIENLEKVEDTELTEEERGWLSEAFDVEPHTEVLGSNTLNDFIEGIEHHAQKMKHLERVFQILNERFQVAAERAGRAENMLGEQFGRTYMDVYTTVSRGIFKLFYKHSERLTKLSKHLIAGQILDIENGEFDGAHVDLDESSEALQEKKDGEDVLGLTDLQEDVGDQVVDEVMEDTGLQDDEFDDVISRAKEGEDVEIGDVLSDLLGDDDDHSGMDGTEI